MTAWKHVLLLLGILGVSGFFAPMLEVKQGRVAIELSARRLSFGLDPEHSILERNLPPLAEQHLPASVRSTRDDARLIAEASRWSWISYVPAALMVLLGLAGIRRRRFGRVLGALALLAGLASIGGWLALYYGIPRALAEAALKRTQVSLLFGAHLLLLVGAAGMAAGIGALLRPDLGHRPPRATPPGPPPGPPPPNFPPPDFPPPPVPPPSLPPPASP